MSQEDISENFDESRHCKNLKFENFGESRTHLSKLQRSLIVLLIFSIFVFM